MQPQFRETLDEKGYIKVDQYLMVKGTTNIFAIGDVANLKVNNMGEEIVLTVHIERENSGACKDHC